MQYKTGKDAYITRRNLFLTFLVSNLILLQHHRGAVAAFTNSNFGRARTITRAPTSFDSAQSKFQKRQRHHHFAINSTRRDVSLDSDGVHGKDGKSSSILKAAVVATAPTVEIEKNDLLGQDVYKNAVRNTLLWVSAAMIFGTGLIYTCGSEVGEEFFAGYLIEESLSVDNLFVFLLLFEYFKVPMEYQNRVLNWGIIGAVVMRAVMIGLGSVAISNFHEILLVFAAILIFSSGKVLFAGDEEEEENLEENAIVKFSSNLVKATPNFDGDRFFTMIDGVKRATPLLLCLVAVEISDVVFAVDSIPAVFGVTENPLVVFSSNMFAIAGLRSLYVILSKAAADLKYLEPAVAVVLAFIGSKMIAEYAGFHVATELSLAVVASLLGIGVGASIWEQKRDEQQAATFEVEDKL